MEKYKLTFQKLYQIWTHLF